MEKLTKKQIRERIKFLEEEQRKEKELGNEHNPHREKNIKKLKEELKGIKGKEKMEEDKVIEFLSESNKIEGEYSDEALQDSKQAWQMACIINEPISPELILGIHRRLMKRLNPKIAGKIRKVDVWVGQRKGLNPEFIKEELRMLCNPGLWPVSSEEQIKRWHIQFEKIHPFLDGNGRTGRILMNLQRIALKLPILTIHSNSNEQVEYYKWFH